MNLLRRLKKKKTIQAIQVGKRCTFRIFSISFCKSFVLELAKFKNFVIVSFIALARDASCWLNARSILSFTKKKGIKISIILNFYEFNRV